MKKRNTYFLFLYILLSLLLRNSSLAQGIEEEIKSYHKRALTYSRVNMDSALGFISLARQLIDSTNNAKQRAINKNFEAHVYFIDRRDSKAYIKYLNAQDLYSDSDNLTAKVKYQLQRNLGAILFRNEMYSEALLHYDTCLNILKDTLNTVKKHASPELEKDMVTTIHYSNQCLRHLGKYQRAKENCIALLRTKEAKQDLDLRTNIINQLGLIHKDIEEYELARNYHDIIIEDTTFRDLYRIRAIHNKANTYLLEMKYDSAVLSFVRSINWATRLISEERSERLTSQLFISRMDLGETLFNQGSIREAIAMWERAIDEYSTPIVKPIMIPIFSWLDKAYRTLGKDSMATSYQRNYEDYLRLSLTNADAIKAQTERDNLKTLLQQKKQSEKELKLKQKYWALLSSLIVLIVIWQIVAKQKKKKKSHALNRRLRDILMKE